MRTTVHFDEDVTKAIMQLRRDQGLDVSEAVNELIRRGLRRRDAPKPFRQTTRSIGLLIDVANVSGALDSLESSGSKQVLLVANTLPFEHGLQLISADTDFARHTGIVWHNPVAS